MPLEKFEIELHNSHRSYFAGQVVSGVVKLVLTEKSKLIHGEEYIRGFFFQNRLELTEIM